MKSLALLAVAFLATGVAGEPKAPVGEIEADCDPSVTECAECHHCVEGSCVANVDEPGCNFGGVMCRTARPARCFQCRDNLLGHAQIIRGRDTHCCPTGVPVIHCAKNPCDDQSTDCPFAAACIADYCGSCNANYYNALWQPICQQFTEY